jgi:small-conductance mechanosensitive channel
MLSNFFAGVYLLTDKPIKSGDFISIDSEDSKTKGFVEEIGWRTTKLRTLSNYIHLIPNDKLAQSVIINFTGTKESKPVSVSVGVCYECDSELVEKTLNSCAQAVIKKWEDADRDFVPIVRTTNFLDSAVEFTVIIAAKNPWNTNAVAADLRKEILFQFKKNKIEIPYPKRVLVKEYSK